MPRRDEYYNRAKQEGYRSRAAYKLRQIDEEHHVISEGDTVVDLGAAPGGWLQVAAELVGDGGTVVGVDRQRIKPVEGVETVKGDMTQERTRERVLELVDEVDTVVSDMAPNMTGEYSLDHARSVGLAEIALETALAVLKPGGNFVVKVFDGPDVHGYRTRLEREFEYVASVRPPASRSESSEQFLVCKRRLTAPVRKGDRVEVTIEAIGEEGDGIAKVDGFTLFVSDTEEGETLDVRVTDVKHRFGFAERLD